MPTEAQWEYSARAQTTTPWWTGCEVESLDGSCNLADSFAKHNGGPPSWRHEEWLDDGYIYHSPVDAFRANPFGLHDVHGNLWEWCRDAYGDYGKCECVSQTGERVAPGESLRVFRGGAFNNAAIGARSACRHGHMPDSSDYTLGVRPAREIH